MSENQEDNLGKALVPEEEAAAEETEKVEKPKKVKKEETLERPVWVSVLTVLWLPAVTLLFEFCFSRLVGYPFSRYTVLLSLTGSALITGLVLLIPKRKVRMITFGVITNILTVIYIAQYIYFRIFGTIFVWGSIAAGGAGAVVEYFSVVRSAIIDGLAGYPDPSDPVGPVLAGHPEVYEEDPGTGMEIYTFRDRCFSRGGSDRTAPDRP